MINSAAASLTTVAIDLTLFCLVQTTSWPQPTPASTHQSHINPIPFTVTVIVKRKVVPLQARCGSVGSRRFRLPDFHDIRHMKVVRSSASRIGRLYLQEIFLVLTFTRGWVDSRAMVRSEGNMSLKNPVTPPGIDPGTVPLVAQRINHYANPGPFNLYGNDIETRSPGMLSARTITAIGELINSRTIRLYWVWKNLRTV